jgi:hypothetical protein
LVHNGVSVVIPCYNQARYLPDAVESVLRQAAPDAEVVVVDDGSDDGTAAVARRYAGVRCIRQDNRGLARARNAGFVATRGRYVVFLDADDRLLPGALDAGRNTLARHPGCGFVVGHHRRIAADGTRLPTPLEPCLPEDGERAYEALLRMNCISMPAKVMFRREVVEALGGFDPTNPAAADYDMYLRVARSLPVRCHHAEIAEYRMHGQNMTCNPRLMLRATLAALEAQRAWVRGHRAYRAAWNAGRIFAVEYYGRHIAAEVRRGLRAGELAVVGAGLLMLVRFSRRSLFRAFCRAATAALARRRPPEPTAGATGPLSGSWHSSPRETA